MKIISFFNHKGGVCKTTTVFHLGWMLSQKGKRVLMVDTDSQCNLTLTVIGDQEYESFSSAQPDNNIKSCLDIAFDSKPELIKAPNCVNVKEMDALYLLPGSFDITEFEVQLGVSFQLSNSFSTLKNLPGSFYFLFQKCAEKLNIDYILVDLNPSLSSINQGLLSSSDYFVLPASPDYFSQMAIKSMARILPQWERWAIEARKMFSSSTYPLPNIKPKFLGYTINDFTIRNKQPAAAFGQIIDKIDNTVNSILYPALTNVDMTIELSNYQDNSLCLAKISNFQTLQAKYQEFGVPVFALTDKQIGSSGVVLEGQQTKRDEFNTIFSDLADKIISLVNL